MRGPYYLDLKNGDAVRSLMRMIGPDPAGTELMLDKARIYPLYLQGVKSAAANILKQQMLSLGGEAVVGRWVVNSAREESDVLLLGTAKHYRALTDKLSGQPWGLQEAGARLGTILEGLDQKRVVVWKWPGRELTVGKRALVAGILNITPDSFSDGGRFVDPPKALAHAREMMVEGADLIDIGGESTRPGAQPVSPEEELERVMPVLELLLKEIPLPISLDTYKASTAKAALDLGVHIINDVGGGKKDAQIARVVADHEAPVIIMHNQKRDSRLPFELAVAVTEDLAESVRIYEDAGLSRDKMMVDPGIGFGKDIQGNLAALHYLGVLKTLGLPFLLGVSRKSFIGAVLDAPVADRLEGSLAAAAWGVMNGADVFRVHDVKETVRVVRMLETISKVGDANE